MCCLAICLNFKICIPVCVGLTLGCVLFSIQQAHTLWGQKELKLFSFRVFKPFFDNEE